MTRSTAMLLLAFAATTASLTNAYSVPSPSSSSDNAVRTTETAGAARRDVFKAVATTAFGVALPSVANALEACPAKSQNCVRTTWTPPAGASKDAAIQDLKDVINAYPQEGQNKVDGGGWRIAEESLSADGTARVEYLSDPKGNFARFLNGGKSFVDDLKIEVASSGVTEIKSQSRIGESDLGVNGKVS